LGGVAGALRPATIEASGAVRDLPVVGDRSVLLRSFPLPAARLPGLLMWSTDAARPLSGLHRDRNGVDG